jgi:hypothetical protein
VLNISAVSRSKRLANWVFRLILRVRPDAVSAVTHEGAVFIDKLLTTNPVALLAAQATEG